MKDPSTDNPSSASQLSSGLRRPENNDAELLSALGRAESNGAADSHIAQMVAQSPPRDDSQTPPNPLDSNQDTYSTSQTLPEQAAQLATTGTGIEEDANNIARSTQIRPSAPRSRRELHQLDTTFSISLLYAADPAHFLFSKDVDFDGDEEVGPCIFRASIKDKAEDLEGKEASVPDESPKRDQPQEKKTEQAKINEDGLMLPPTTPGGQDAESSRFVTKSTKEPPVEENLSVNEDSRLTVGESRINLELEANQVNTRQRRTRSANRPEHAKTQESSLKTTDTNSAPLENDSSQGKRNAAPPPDGSEDTTTNTQKIKLPQFLDKETMGLVKDYLIAEYGGAKARKKRKTTRYLLDLTDFCDDDAMVDFMLRMNRQAEQQTNFVVHNRMAQRSLVKKRNHGEESFSDDDDDDDIARLVDEFVQIEEEQALGHDLFQTMVQNIQKAKATTSKQKKRKSSNGVLDKRTIGWLRKTAGLHTGTDAPVANYHHPAIKSMIEEEGRRFTRGMARQHHDKKQQRRKQQQTSTGAQPGISALAFVVEDLEQEIERPEKRIKQSKRSRSVSPVPQEELPTADAATARSKRTHRNEDDMLKDRNEKTAMRTKGPPANGDQVARIKVSKSATDQDDEPLALKLRHSDLKRENHSQHLHLEDAYDPLTLQQPAALPQQYTKEGLVLRAPSWPMVNPRKKTDHTSAHQQQPVQPKLAQQRRQVHAHYCALIMKHLSGKSRSRARYEFFYGDLDKAWYNRNDFVRKAAELGIAPGTRLTALEWKAVRTCISRGKPRRFSKAFLDEQRHDRDRYRRNVRSIQNFNKKSAPPSDLDRDEPVPARIPAGSVVTAFNSRYRILQRGVVLSYEVSRNLYLIRFPPGYGNLFCPDFEVARHGIPELLAPSLTNTLGDATRQMAGGSHLAMSSSLSMNGAEGCGTSLRNLSLSEKPWDGKDLFESETNGKVQDLVGSKSSSEIDNAVEREMVALIVGAVKDVVHRKNKILECLEKLHDDPSWGDEDRKQHIDWLLTNLDATNVVLERGIHYMRCLYGSIYLSHHETPLPSKNDVIGWLLSSRGRKENTPTDIAQRQRVSRRPVIKPPQSDLDAWSRRLILDSEDVCRHFLGEMEGLELDRDSSFKIDRVASVGTLLLGSSLMEEKRASFVDVHGLESLYYTHELMFDQIESATTSNEKTVTALSSSGTSNSSTNKGLVNCFAEAVVNQRSAVDELKEAIAAWSAEVASQAMLQQ